MSSSFLPPHWQAKRLKHVTVCLDGRRVPLSGEDRSYRQGVFPYWGANGIVDHIDSFIFDEPLVLLGEDGAPFFDRAKNVAFVATGRYWVNNHIHVLRPQNIEPRFLAYLLNCTDYSPFINGSTRDKLTQGQMKSIPIPYPPPDEQRAIADFLDRETTKIDGLIDAKRSLIERILEKRRTYIAEACIRGLDADVTRKQSGVPTIGEIPKHWNVIRNKVLFREVDERSIDGTEELLTVSHLTGVSRRSEKPEVTMFMAESLEGYKKCKKNDLIINTMWAWMGALGISDYEGLVSPGYNVYRLRLRALPAFLDLLYRTSQYVAEFTRWSKGVWESRLRLYPFEFSQILTPLPPYEEQQAIVADVEVKTGGFRNAIETLAKSISKLEQYRYALLSAAVTGQIDVRTYRPQDVAFADQR